MKLAIKTFGGLEFYLDGKALALPTKKARALLVFLAMSPSDSRSRAQLSGVLWGRSAEEQARASLRQTLSSVRKALGEAADLVTASSDQIGLDGANVEIDVDRFAHLIESSDLASLQQAVPIYSGDFLEGFHLNEEGFERWVTGERRVLKESAIQLLVRLIDRHTVLKEYEDGLRLAQKLLRLDELQERAHRTVMELYQKLGRRDAALKQYESCVSILQRELGIEPDSNTQLLYQQINLQNEGAAASASSAVISPAPALTQKIDFCTSLDGVRIAYATAGTGPPIVKAANWLNHLEYDWQSPIWKHFFEFLTRKHTLVRYDERGNGMSDWEVADISLPRLTEDLEAVIDAAGVEKFPLIGISRGASRAIEYSVKHPGKASHLILIGGCASWSLADTDEKREKALEFLIEDGWGQENPAFRQFFTSLFIPGVTGEQMDWFNELQRRTTSPANASRLRNVSLGIDVTDLLPRVTVPTLIVHSRGDVITPLAKSEEMAAGIPGAKLVVLESNNHLILENEPAWSVFCWEIEKFLSDT